MISWLCLMFREIPLSPPQLIVLVYVHVLWLLASKTHNLIWRKVSCYAYLFITNETAHKIPLSTLLTWLHWHSQSVEGCVTNWKWENIPSVLWLHEEKLWSRGKGKPSRCSFALHVLLLPQKLVDLQPWCESLVTSRSTVMILPVSFAESKLCHRQSRQQTLDAWNDTSQWNGHWQAEGRSCGTRKGQCYSTDGSQEPHTLS